MYDMGKIASGKEMVLGSFGLETTQITVETLGAMKKCDKVFLSALEEAEARRLSAYFPATESISRMPWEKQEKLLENFFRSGNRAGVIHYGDPDFLCGLTFNLDKFCRERGIKFTVLRAVSSLPPLLRLLEQGNLGGRGVRLVCLRPDNWPAIKQSLDPDIPTFIFEPDALTAPKNATLRRDFLSAMSGKYPPERKCILTTVGNLRETGDTLIPCTVSTLGKNLSKITPRTTLYIAGKTE